MKISAIKAGLPTLTDAFLAAVSAILLTLAFPDFELWFLAYVALIPLFTAIDRNKESFAKSLMTGWLFGTIFFFGSCWWLTFAPITYGGVPTIISYFLLLGAASIVGLLPALFGGLFSLILKRFGAWGILVAPFLWIATEFLRFWTTGNNWNAIAYSQAFVPNGILKYAGIGGIYLTGFYIVAVSAFISFLYIILRFRERALSERINTKLIAGVVAMFLLWFAGSFVFISRNEPAVDTAKSADIIAVQPNVPMSGIKYDDWLILRDHHVQLAENALRGLRSKDTENRPAIVVFPESPMNFGYTQDREFQQFLRAFTAKNNVQVLFNAAEPTDDGSGFYNSAVLVNKRAEKIAQYDKIHLVPFGEYVPLPQPLAQLMPTMVGNFELGKEYDIVPLGEAKGGIMICFESHFPTLSRQFALRGADALIEMTNDGYLGETPVLRQHLANAVFRAVETNRPVLRVTNVGITAYIDNQGGIREASKPYTEDSRIWSVSKSDGVQTFYVKYGDWFAWLCSIVSLVLLAVALLKRRTIVTVESI